MVSSSTCICPISRSTIGVARRRRHVKCFRSRSTFPGRIFEVCAFGSMTPVTAQDRGRILGQGNAAQFIGEDRFKGAGAGLYIAKLELSDC